MAQSKNRSPPFKGPLKKPPIARPWLFGYHAVMAALKNPRRRCHTLLYTPDQEHTLPFPEIRNLHPGMALEKADSRKLLELLGAGATHQGLALQVTPLIQPSLDDLLATLSAQALLLVLDHVTDPHNVGAILRSAAAFGAGAVIQHVHNAPDPNNAIISKTASGALESVPLISVSNLAQTLDHLKTQDFWCIGFAENEAASLPTLDLKGRIALVMGSEGDGLRRLVRHNCDMLASIPTQNTFSTLNVSNAAAVALYEYERQREPQEIPPL